MNKTARSLFLPSCLILLLIPLILIPLQVVSSSEISSIYFPDQFQPPDRPQNLINSAFIPSRRSPLSVPIGVSASKGAFTDKILISWNSMTFNHKVFLPLVFSGGGSSPIYPLLNGDFEAGPDVGWTQYSSNGWELIYQNTEGFPQSGEWFAFLGWDHDETSRLSQPVTISASQPYLHFWVWFESKDDCGYDFFYIIINGTELAKYDLCDENNTYGWVPVVRDLSAYSGQTVTVTFEVTTDSSLNSNLFLDDVSLSASATAAAPEPNLLASPLGFFQQKGQPID